MCVEGDSFSRMETLDGVEKKNNRNRHFDWCLACNSIRHGEVVRESIEKRRSNFSSVPALKQFATEIQSVLRRIGGGKEDGELLLK